MSHPKDTRQFGVSELAQVSKRCLNGVSIYHIVSNDYVHVIYFEPIFNFCIVVFLVNIFDKINFTYLVLTKTLLYFLD